jgi:hypothetical protein
MCFTVLGALFGMTSDLPSRYFDGYIDGIVNGAICGWVIDPENPDRPVTVCIKVNNRFVGRSCAIHYRSELVERFGTRGLHGIVFALDPEVLSAHHLKIEIIADNGLPLSNKSSGYLTTRVGGRGIPPPKTGPTALFLHIPKTGGTAFRSMVRKNLFFSERLLIYDDPPGIPVEKFCLLTESQLKQFRLIYGHFFFGLHEYMPEQCRYVTVLRDPVRRFISHYFNHVRRYQIDRAHLNPGGLPPSEEFDNLMVRYISGGHPATGEVSSRHLHRAVRNLDRYFDFIGIAEDLSTWTDLQAYFGFEGEMGRENVGEYDASEFDVEPWKSHLIHISAYDIELYRYAQKLAQDRQKIAATKLTLRQTA